MSGRWRYLSKDQIKILTSLLAPWEKRIIAVLIVVSLLSGVGTLIIIDQKYSTPVPAEGGSFVEGVIGAPHKINPLLAVSDVDRDLVDLIYAGLMRADGKGGLAPELAESYEVSDDNLSYTFTLKKNFYWHDDGIHRNETVDADDVVYTIETVKNRLINSPKRANWEGVEVKKIDQYTVQFILKRPYAPFLENTTLGILPEHLWKSLIPQEFERTDLNTLPIGAGPYKYESIEQNENKGIERYHLKANERYLPSPPYIKRISFYFYSRPQQLVDAYTAGLIGAFSVPPNMANSIEGNASYHLFRIVLPRIFALFFNQSASAALADPAVRRAIEETVQRDEIIASVLNGYGYPQDAPIFPIEDTDATTTPTYAPEEIRETLKKNGWEENEDGLLQKKMKKETLDLSFTISTSNNEELVKTANILKRQLEAVGMRVQVESYELTDLEISKIRPRNYDALLFGQVVGFRPNPYPFWHSSQREDPGYNVALYTNTKTDKLAEEIRTNLIDEELKEKSEAFVKEIKKDRPAVFLYSPTYLYFVKNNIQGVHLERITLGAERFSNIENWYINTKRLWNIFL